MEILDLTQRKRPYCKPCQEEGSEVEMERSNRWERNLLMYVRTWECPKCDRRVMRDRDPEIET